MIFSARNVLALGMIATLTACGHGLPIRDADPAQARANGYYRGGADASGRTGVGNYVSRVCSKGGWGAPDSSCAGAPAPVAAAPAPKAAAPAVAAIIDTDGDGVADSADQCPKSKAGAKVNAFGCEASEKVAIRLNVNFPTGSAAVPATAHSELKGLASILKANSNIKIRVEGHTDNTGNAAANSALSAKRASAIQAYLQSEGAASGQVEAKGFGPAQPIAANTTKTGRAQNRRVVAVVTQQ